MAPRGPNKDADIEWVECPEHGHRLGRPPAMRRTASYPRCPDCSRVMTHEEDDDS